MNCECKVSLNVFNGVCGLCLLPLVGVIHSESGAVIDDEPTDTSGVEG